MSHDFRAAVAIPTIDSASYIHASLERLRKEIVIAARKRPIDIIVCINGVTATGGSDPSVARVNDFKAENPAIPLYILEVEDRGKNNAINEIVAFAKAQQYDIIHLIDDDVGFKDGSILLNIEELIFHSAIVSSPVCVGSHFLAVRHDFRHFYRKKSHRLLPALKSWFAHNVFSVPFRAQSDRPNFCSGASMCFWTKDVPQLPLDETGIADDVYLSNYYAVTGREWYEKTHTWPVIKPAESIVYFEVTAQFGEWQRQQLRTCLGVLSGYGPFFPENMPLLEKFREWAYTYHPNSLRKEKLSTLRAWFFSVIYRFLKRRVAGKARRAMCRHAPVDWGTAISTKLFAKTPGTLK